MPAYPLSRRDAVDEQHARYRKPSHVANSTAGRVRILLDKDASLEAITDLVQERKQIEYEVEATIGAALTAGASWADIGAALGVRRQSAAEKYGRARLTYASQPDDEKARLDRQAGVSRRPIMFEVRDQDGSTVSRHKTAKAAWKRQGVATRRRKCDCPTLGVMDGTAAPHLKCTGAVVWTVWKVWPSGRAVQMVVS